MALTVLGLLVGLASPAWRAPTTEVDSTMPQFLRGIEFARGFFVGWAV
jgi:hypothetical protein